ncbi:MAG TPA: phospholipase D family protein [Methylophilaceae bacterium]|jgi:putative cardiolipin synthase
MFKKIAYLFFLAQITACSLLNVHQSPPKEYSTSFSHPEQTSLGRQYIKSASSHDGLSGFYILNNGVDGFYARVSLIDKAEASLDLQYYIFRQDDTGKLLTAHLLKAADRGVKIRILVDDAATENGDQQLLTLSAHPNIQVRVFNPLRYRGHGHLLRLVEMTLRKSTLDYRMHNKLFIVDGAVALFGGRNIGDEYFQTDPESQFGDDDVFTIGPVIQKLSQSFDEYWNSNMAIPAKAVDSVLSSIESLESFRTSLSKDCEALEDEPASFLKSISASNQVNNLMTASVSPSWANAEVIYDSPDKKEMEDDKMTGSLIYNSFAELAKATRSELLIITPFFVPGDDGMALFKDMYERNVETKVLTNSLESTPQLAAHSGYKHYRKELLTLDIKLYEIRASLGKAAGSGESKKLLKLGNYGLHAKQYISDRKKILLGSMNLDQRSLHLNTEIGMVINSPELAKQEAERFKRLTDPENSYQVYLKNDPVTKQSALVWITKENGKLVEYGDEPSKNLSERLKTDLMSLLPLDDEL